MKDAFALVPDSTEKLAAPKRGGIALGGISPCRPDGQDAAGNHLIRKTIKAHDEANS